MTGRDIFTIFDRRIFLDTNIPLRIEWAIPNKDIGRLCRETISGEPSHFG
jgi:hypothetical protein